MSDYDEQNDALIDVINRQWIRLSESYHEEGKRFGYPPRKGKRNG